MYPVSSSSSSSAYAGTENTAEEESSSPSSFFCPITNEIMKDPVIDKHGHSFERAAIEKWLTDHFTCPISRELITPKELTPNRALKEAIEISRMGFSASTVAYDRNVPKPKGSEQEDALSKPLLANGEECEKTGDLKNAEKFYTMALQYTSKSEDYAHLPQLFAKGGEKERAAAAYDILADLQLKEGKKAEAIDSLKRSLKLFSHPSIKEKLGELLEKAEEKREAATLFLEAAQHYLCAGEPSSASPLCQRSLKTFPGLAEGWKMLAALTPPSAVETLLKGANESTMPLKERIELCKMAILKEPNHLQANALLLGLNQLRTEQKIKKLKALLPLPPAVPTESKSVSDDLRKISPLLNVFDESEWTTYVDLAAHELSIEDAPALDKSAIIPLVKKSLSALPIEGNAGITLLTIPKGLTFNKLVKLAGSPKKGNIITFRNICDPISKKIGDIPIDKTYRILITNNVFKGSRKKTYAAQKKLVQKIGWEMPRILEATLLVVTTYMSLGKRLYGDSPWTYTRWTYTRCLEQVDGHPSVVGGFGSDGLDVVYYYYDCDGDDYGAAGALRKF